jgi:phosphonatase-like hydrolase
MDMEIQLAVFDLAGTTVNDPDGVSQCLRASLQAVGVDVDRAAVNAVMGLPKPEAIRRLLEDHPAAADLLPRVEAIHDDFVGRMIRFYQSDPSVFEISGTSAVFSRLREAGIQVAVNTGFGRDITAVLLDRLGWERRGLLQASVTSDEVPRGRPYPDMIQHLMRRLGVADARQVIKVGDTPADLQEGTNAGCALVIGVTRGSHSREQLDAQPHTHLVDSVAEVPGLLGLSS